MYILDHEEEHSWPEDGLEETGQPQVGFCFLAANQSVAQWWAGT